MTESTIAKVAKEFSVPMQLCFQLLGNEWRNADESTLRELLIADASKDTSVIDAMFAGTELE